MEETKENSYGSREEDWKIIQEEEIEENNFLEENDVNSVPEEGVLELDDLIEEEIYFSGSTVNSNRSEEGYMETIKMDEDELYQVNALEFDDLPPVDIGKELYRQSLATSDSIMLQAIQHEQEEAHNPTTVIEKDKETNDSVEEDQQMEEQKNEELLNEERLNEDILKKIHLTEGKIVNEEEHPIQEKKLEETTNEVERIPTQDIEALLDRMSLKAEEKKQQHLEKKQLEEERLEQEKKNNINQGETMKEEQINNEVETIIQESLELMKEETPIDLDRFVMNEEKEEKTPEQLVENKTKEKNKFLLWIKNIFGNVPDEKEVVLSELEIERLEEEKRKQRKLEKEKKIEENKKKRQEKKALREEQNRIKKSQKEAKALQKKERLEQEKAMAEPQGRINRFGATIVLAFTILLGFFIVGGTISSSHKVAITTAENAYFNGNYEKAYKTLAGIKLKEDEKAFFNKVETIMYLQRSLDSYDNYTKMSMATKALHSLLKGIEQYEEHLEKAVEVGVEEKYKGLKKTILEKLEKDYGIKEDEVYEIIELEESDQYYTALNNYVEKME